MQHRYSGDIGDFGKFLLLKYLFTHESIATIWYLYPDESHNTDGSHRVEEGNTKLYRNCIGVDPHMCQLFNKIHANTDRRVEWFEEYNILENGVYFTEFVTGEGYQYRKQWVEKAIDFIKAQKSTVVCLDPDNGVEPTRMEKLTFVKQGKYATYTEIKCFFEIEGVEHLVIYQHFNRLKKHEAQMIEAKMRFEKLYGKRVSVTILRHNPIQARFYIILSKVEIQIEAMRRLLTLKYTDRYFFSRLEMP